MRFARRCAWIGPAGLVAALLAACPAVVHAGGAGAGTAAAGACTITNGLAAQPLDGTASGTDGVFVDSACPPSLSWLSPLGGAIVPSAPGDWSPPVVAAGGGDAYVLASGAAGTALEALSPAGETLWRLPLPFGGTLEGDAQVLVVQTYDRAAIIDPVTRHVAVVAYPDWAAVENEGGTSQTDMTAVGGLVLATTRYGDNASLDGNDGPTNGLATRVQVYDAQGALVRRFSVADKPLSTDEEGNAVDSFDDTATRVVGDTAYILFTDAGDGSQAGVYTLTASDRLRGPYPVPPGLTSSDDGSFAALAGGYLVLAVPDGLAPFPGGCSRSLVGAYRVTASGLRALWRTNLPGCGLTPDGADVALVSTPYDGEEPDVSRVTVVAAATGRTADSFPAGPAAGIEADGPFGFLLTAGRALRLYGPSGNPLWTATLPATPFMDPLSGPPTPELLDLGGRPALFLGADDLAVTWGGVSDAAVPVGFPWELQSAATATAPPPAPTSGIVGYALRYKGQAIDARHPLVVTAAMAGHELDLTLTAVNSAGAPVPSAAPVHITVSDASGSGTVQYDPDTGQVGLDRGQSTATVHYMNATPGSYTLTVSPTLSMLADFVPSVPAFTPAASTITAWVDLRDANGVPAVLPPGAKVLVLASGSGVLAQQATASATAPGLYGASFRTADAGPAPVSFTAEVWAYGGVYGSPSPAASTIVTGSAAPVVTARAQGAAVAVTVADSGAEPPLAYALYRLPGAGAALSAGTPPVAVLDVASAATAEAAYIDTPPGAGPWTYVAQAIYPEGSLGPTSAPVTVDE